VVAGLIPAGSIEALIPELVRGRKYLRLAMMAALFLAWFAAFVLAWTGRRVASVVVALVSLLLCMAMLRYHMSDDITISL
jgi:L-lactate permease